MADHKVMKLLRNNLDDHTGVSRKIRRFSKHLLQYFYKQLQKMITKFAAST